MKDDILPLIDVFVIAGRLDNALRNASLFNFAPNDTCGRFNYTFGP